MPSPIRIQAKVFSGSPCFLPPSLQGLNRHLPPQLEERLYRSGRGGAQRLGSLVLAAEAESSGKGCLHSD